MSPYELAVGVRYTRARRGSGRNRFISFIALTSMAGIALGVAALIVVLSVMNGFQEELRTRILSVASHIEIRGLPALADDAAVAKLAGRSRRAESTSAMSGRKVHRPLDRKIASVGCGSMLLKKSLASEQLLAILKAGCTRGQRQ